MRKEDFNTNDLIRYAKIDVYKQMCIPIMVMIYSFFCIGFYKNIIFACFVLLHSSIVFYYLFTYLKNYFRIKKTCNYLGIEFGYCTVLWSNLIDCILTDEVIALYKNKQYNYFQYSDIFSMEISRKRKGTRRNASGVYRRYIIYLKIILKDKREFEFVMYSNSVTICRPFNKIRDICPIVLEKNRHVIITDNSQKGLFDFDFRQ